RQAEPDSLLRSSPLILTPVRLICRFCVSPASCINKERRELRGRLFFFDFTGNKEGDFATRIKIPAPQRGGVHRHGKEIYYFTQLYDAPCLLPIPTLCQFVRVVLRRKLRGPWETFLLPLPGRGAQRFPLTPGVSTQNHGFRAPALPTLPA